jgi:hypothetical protein
LRNYFDIALDFGQHRQAAKCRLLEIVHQAAALRCANYATTSKFREQVVRRGVAALAQSQGTENVPCG